MVTMVLLKEAFTCATPEVMFLRSLRLTRAVSGFANFCPSFRYQRCRNSSSYIGLREEVPRDPKLLLLAGDRLCRTLAGTGVGVGPLTAHRKAAAMTEATVVAEIHEPL